MKDNVQNKNKNNNAFFFLKSIPCYYSRCGGDDAWAIQIIVEVVKGFRLGTVHLIKTLTHSCLLVKYSARQASECIVVNLT